MTYFDSKVCLVFNVLEAIALVLSSVLQIRTLLVSMLAQFLKKINFSSSLECVLIPTYSFNSSCKNQNDIFWTKDYLWPESHGMQTTQLAITLCILKSTWQKLKLFLTTCAMIWINFNVNRSLAQQFCQIAWSPHFNSNVSINLYNIWFNVAISWTCSKQWCVTLMT
jgi:hypothetical protein